MADIIHTRALFKSRNIPAGSNGESDAIDLRDIAENGDFAVSWSISKVGAGSAGTTVFSYSGAPVFAGTYVTPTGGTFGTQTGTAGGSNIVSFTPPVFPFIKIKAAAGADGTSNVTAFLHVR